MSTRVTITVDGSSISAEAGRPLGAVLLGAGIEVLRHSVRSGAPRGLFCGMGVCFECLVTIDGTPERRACITPVRDGMRVETGQP